MRDSIEKILEDADDVFRFDETRPQERAHEYLRQHGVARESGDTAMQCACRHMIKRTAALFSDMQEAAEEFGDSFDRCMRSYGELMGAIDRMEDQCEYQQG